MKKLILAAFSLGMVAVAAPVIANNNASNNAVSVRFNDDRKVIKAEELPEAVRKTLSGEEYKGYTITEAAEVHVGEAKHYEVSLTKEKETKLVKLDANGVVLK